MLAWIAKVQGSVVSASSLAAPDPGADLTPVQVAVAGIAELPAGERRARQQSLAATAKLIPYMALTQASEVLGCPVHVLASRDPAYVAADVIQVIGFGWSAS